MNAMNIYLTGVGGQGIGMISEVLLRSADHAGLPVKGVDTHGLAQRGGIVVSHLRMGADIHSPLIREKEADLVVALERHEALRGAGTYLKKEGTLIYYNTVWQPLSVRLGGAKEIDQSQIEAYCKEHDMRVLPIFEPGLPDARMQNIALLAGIEKHKLLPGLSKKHFEMAINDLMEGPMLDKNMALFQEKSG